MDNNIWNTFDGLNSSLQEPGINTDKENKEANDEEILSSEFLYCENDEKNEIIINDEENEIIIEEYDNIIDKEKNESMEEESESTTEENESMEESSNNSDESSIGDIEDFYGGSLANAINDLNSNYKQDKIMWPSQTYKEFMTAVTRYHLSDAAGDAMLHILRKHCIEQIPTSTQKGRIYIDTMDIEGLNLKTQDLVEFEGKIYKLYYRPIIDAIKGLISNCELCKEFCLDYKEKWEARDVSIIFLNLLFIVIINN